MAQSALLTLPKLKLVSVKSPTTSETNGTVAVQTADCRADMWGFHE